MNNLELRPTYTVVVPAAGVGSRMQANVAKQYLKINGKTIIEYTIERLLSHNKINKVVVAIAAHDSIFKTLPLSQDSRVEVVIGGAERSDSVLSGLNACKDNDWVLVHDAARPCVTHDDINELIAFCEKKQQGAILATPVRDTMKRSNDSEQILHSEDRSNLWHAQTPQMFNALQLKKALNSALLEQHKITDEASAIEFAGLPSHIVSGREDNIKITRPSDLNMAAFILKQQQ